MSCCYSGVQVGKELGGVAVVKVLRQFGIKKRSDCSGMPSAVKKKKRCFRGGVNCVVLGELEEVEILLPIVFPGANKRSKSFNNGSISPLNLSIVLGVIRSSADHLCSKGRKNVLPKSGGKLRTLVSKKPVRKTVMTEYMFNKKAGSLLGG